MWVLDWCREVEVTVVGLGLVNCEGGDIEKSHVVDH